MEQTCPDCGAQNYDFARYCRKCGRQLTSAEFSEAPTRGFDHERPPVPPGAAPFGASPSGAAPYPEPPRYVPPVAAPPPGMPVPMHGATMPPARVGTAPMQGGAKKGTNWLLVAALVVLGLALVGALGTWLVVREIRQAVAESGMPNVSVNEAEPTGEGIDPDTLPAELQAWCYPDARVDNSVTGNVGPLGGSVIVMTSEDTVAEVSEYYQDVFEERGTTPQVVRKDDVTVLSGAGANVVVKPKDGSPGLTQVVVSMGKVPGGIVVGPGHPADLPEPPEIPEVPEGEPGAAPPAPPARPAPPPAAPKGR